MHLLYIYSARVRNFSRFSFGANSTLEQSQLVLNSVAFGFADYILQKYKIPPPCKFSGRNVTSE